MPSMAESMDKLSSADQKRQEGIRLISTSDNQLSNTSSKASAMTALLATVTEHEDYADWLATATEIAGVVALAETIMGNAVTSKTTADTAYDDAFDDLALEAWADAEAHLDTAEVSYLQVISYRSGAIVLLQSSYVNYVELEQLIAAG